MIEYIPVKEGKVREIYDIGENLILVATDRISAFDVILKNKITKKGTVLTQMSKFWFDYTKDILPNHMVSTDTADMPEFFRTPEFDGNSMLVKKLTMIPIECIVRGYITGSGWASYKKNGTVCGIELPEGLNECDKLPEPIYTPSTKAEIGDHDENISYEKSIEVLEKAFPGRGEELAAKIRDCTIALYKKCADYALTRGIIIADTKFEFGLDENYDFFAGDEREPEAPPVYESGDKAGNGGAVDIAAALDGPKERVPLRGAAGRRAAGFVVLYPPDVPVAVPGELFTHEKLIHIFRWMDCGYDVMGVENGMVCVEKNEENS